MTLISGLTAEAPIVFSGNVGAAGVVFIFLVLAAILGISTLLDRRKKKKNG
jgi:hypothetical protein